MSVKRSKGRSTISEAANLSTFNVNNSNAIIEGSSSSSRIVVSNENNQQNISPFTLETIDFTCTEDEIHMSEPNADSEPNIPVHEHYWDIGDPTYECKYCGAQMWYGERVRKNRNSLHPTFTLCCLDGKAELPFLKKPPQLLDDLISNRHPLSTHFIDNIRAYNMMFAFTSMGGKIDHSVNQGRGPYTFKMGGQNVHRIGSLLPEGQSRPKFCQLYIYDTEEEVQNRKNVFSDGGSNRFNDDLIHSLQRMIDEKNTLAKIFRMARDRLSTDVDGEVSIRLISRRQTDGRTYNLPTTSEVAALIEGDIGPTTEQRDIIVQKQCGTLQRISELHPSYLPLQYPLLFPSGEDGFRLGILHRESSLKVSKRKNPRNQLTMREWLAFRIQDRPLSREFPMIMLARKLFQQFLVDGYMMVEYQRLSFLRHNQKLLRAETYNNLANAVNQGNVGPSSVGSRIIIPSSYVGADGYMRENYRDTMAISVYTIEFQKRGLPHAHILLFLHGDDKFPEASDIDRVISAEIPDPNEHPELYKAVAEFMIHGPCGEGFPNSPCMIGNKCGRHFPKKPNERTTVDGEGYPIYRRRKESVLLEKNGETVDNGFVVPYNAQLLLKYRAHINVEWCNQSRSIKYLFKYINKGVDRVTMQSSHRRRNDENPEQIDEIRRFYDCRYISACESVWRIFSFNIHFRTPAVERLQFHLPDQQSVVFNDDDPIDEVLDSPTIGMSKFLDWMDCNKREAEARELTYSQFPTKFVWKKELRKWSLRERGFSIGRLQHVTPNCGELYFMRIMLNFAKGPTCYEDIRTVDRVVYPTYREACYALGLLGDDKEYIDAIEEASDWGSGVYLRRLFATLLLSGTISRPEFVWEKTWRLLSDDILHRQRRISNRPVYNISLTELTLTDAELKNYALYDIEASLQRNGSTLRRFDGMPFPDSLAAVNHVNTLLADELSYDKELLHEEHKQLISTMTDEQRSVYNEIMDAVQIGKGGIFFVYGYGGTGKTFIWRTLCAALRSVGEIVLPVASVVSFCNIVTQWTTKRILDLAFPQSLLRILHVLELKLEADLSELLIRTKLIIWDEAPMTHKYCFEALVKFKRHHAIFK
ncbi:uncharacterized protein LOC141628648 [Silene latifolia]|uniref:uncharacterized protein LOC141628648 n=1 Tax=Silene latifolia TaxID=37657 RepID=UPI003D77D52F